MSDVEWGAGNLKLTRGRLCLDFVNTVSWRTGKQPQERLTSYAALVAWGQHAGVLQEPQAARNAASTTAAFEQALILREAIYRIFSTVVAQRAPEAADLATLNGALSAVMLHLHWSAGEFAWRWSGDENALERMLWPVARSAAELLTSDELNRVGMCAGEGCGWLFFDVSKNRSRRWCAMDDCGNRAKARRHYRRSRAQL